MNDNMNECPNCKFRYYKKCSICHKNLYPNEPHINCGDMINKHNISIHSKRNLKEHSIYDTR